MKFQILLILSGIILSESSSLRSGEAETRDLLGSFINEDELLNEEESASRSRNLEETDNPMKEISQNKSLLKSSQIKSGKELLRDICYARSRDEEECKRICIDGGFAGGQCLNVEDDDKEVCVCWSEDPSKGMRLESLYKMPKEIKSLKKKETRLWYDWQIWHQSQRRNNCEGCTCAQECAASSAYTGLCEKKFGCLCAFPQAIN